MTTDDATAELPPDGAPPSGAAAFPGPFPPINIHNHPPAHAARNGTTIKVAVISGFASVAVALVSLFGLWMVNAVAKVQSSVAEVHVLSNANLAAQREIARVAEQRTEALRVELATANQRIAELSERIGGMVPAPAPEPVVP